MLPGITPALFKGSQIDAYTKLLLHFDGANNSTVFTDSSPSAHGNAVIGGSAGAAKVSTAFSKFGGSAAFFDGATGWSRYASSVDWEFGGGDFTVDWWEYRQAGGVGCAPIVRDNSILYTPWMLGYYQAPNLVFFASSNATSWDISSAQPFGALELNVWHHFAVSRNGNTFYLFRDGVLGAAFGSSLAFPANGGAVAIGGSWQNQYFGGFFDEVRISKGIARWTANFTPPTAPYS